MNTKISDMIKYVGNNVRRNAIAYSAAGIMAVSTACGGGPKTETITDFDNLINDSTYVLAQKRTTQYNNNLHVGYVIEKTMHDGTLIRYTDYGNDNKLNIVSIMPEGERSNILYVKPNDGRIFEAASRDYTNLRNQIRQINLNNKIRTESTKAKADSVTIDKYFR